jgi:AraC-like DNA-binding protein
MPKSVISVFSEPDQFQSALREDGLLNLLVTGSGQFRARLTQVTLHHLHLSAGDERVSRIAFATIPADAVFVSLPADDREAPIWDGMEMDADEMITLGPGERVHARTDGPCRWGAIRLPVTELARYAGALRGAGFAVPCVARWRPPRVALRQLRHFHRAAVRTAQAQSGVLADSETAHGLEQQLINALIDSLSLAPVYQETAVARRRCAILAHFEDLLEAEPLPSLREIVATLGVSLRALRDCCNKNLGISPNHYRRLRAMQLAHRTLRYAIPSTASISAVAHRCGFRDLGSFAASYRLLYGEPPSVTLRRGQGMSEFTSGRRLKVS